MTFKPFKHHKVEIKRHPGKLVSCTIEITRHTGKVDTYGLTVPQNGRNMSDKHNIYWEVRDALEGKGYNFDEVYY